MGPLRNLRLSLRDPKLKPSQLLAIERLRSPSKDHRDRTCEDIERAVSQPLEDSSCLTYRQLVMDVKLEMAAHHRIRDCFWIPHGYVGPPPPHEPSTQRIAAAAKGFAAFYAERNLSPLQWVRAALFYLPHGGIVEEKERQGRLQEVYKSLIGTGRNFRFVDHHWVEGENTHNPMWIEGQARYWE